MISFDGAGLVAQFRQFTESVTAAAGESALRKTGVAGAAVFRAAAKENAARNRKTGVLTNNIIMKRLEEAETESRQAYLVTVRTGKFNNAGDAFYWRFVEGGHKNIKRKKSGQTLRQARALAAEFGTSRTPAYPFMRPAYESHKAAALAAMETAMSKAVKEAIGGL